MVLNNVLRLAAAAAVVGSAAASPLAFASTDEAWKQLDALATKKCVYALMQSHGGGVPVSSLLRARVRGIGGGEGDYYAQVFDWKTAAGSESWLCLMDKKTHKVTLGQYESVQ